MSSKPRFPLDASQRLALAKQLDREIRALHRRRNADLARIAYKLAHLKTTRAYLSLGFSSARDYAWKVLGWRAGKTKAILGLVERLPQQPLIEAAFRAGELPWTKAVRASRGAARDPEREAEWLAAALAQSCQELDRKLAEEAGEPVKRGVYLEATEEQHAVLSEWLRGLRSEGRDELTLVEALVEVAQRDLTTGAVGSSSFRVLLELCRACGQVSHVAGDERLPLSPALAEELVEGAEVYDASQRGARGDTQDVPKAVKDEVRARAGDCCEIPGCTNREHLHFHHHRGRGRGHAADEILLLCSPHHQAPHSGALRLRGRSVSEGIEVTLADGTPLGVIGGVT